MAQVGNFVRNGDPLIAVTQVDQFELDAEIPDGQADEVLASKTIRFESRGQSWPVELLRLSPVIDSQGRTRQARFTFSRGAPSVGRSGELVWQVGTGMLPSNRSAAAMVCLVCFCSNQARPGLNPYPVPRRGAPHWLIYRPQPVLSPWAVSVYKMARQ